MQSPRSHLSQAKYEAFKSAHQHDPTRLNSFDFNDETIVKEFTHWVIIQNRFPYDTMTKTNDLMVAREPAPDFYSTSTAAQTEFHEIMQQLAAEAEYDARIENFPKTTSVKEQFHIHLVKWHGA